MPVLQERQSVESGKKFANNSYWLFGDKSRLVVVVKNADAGTYNYIYVGMFKPYSNSKSLATRITEAAVAGGSVLRVGDSSIFTIGEKYMIADTQGGGFVITGANGESKNIAPSEMFTVVGISGNKLATSRLSYSYTIGSVVGEDPV